MLVFTPQVRRIFPNPLAPLIKLRTLAWQKHLLYARGLFEPAPSSLVVVVERRDNSCVERKARVNGAFRQRLVNVLFCFVGAACNSEGPCKCVVGEDVSAVA